MSDHHPAAAPSVKSGKTRQKVPPFARYKGTSAWRKDRRRVREYARFRAAAGLAKPAPATVGA